MKTCYLCDDCNEPIHKPQQGFVIQGNVYSANPDCREGVIGNNIPIVNLGEKIGTDEIQENVYCKKCLINILSLDVIEQITPENDVIIAEKEFMRQLREMN